MRVIAGIDRLGVAPVHPRHSHERWTGNRGAGHVEVAPIKYTDDGRRHFIQIGDRVEIEVEDFVPPQNPDAEVFQRRNVVHPVNSTQNIGRATTSRFRAFGQEFSHEGKYAQPAPFSWAA
jgi:hypothetical protein